MIARPIFIQYFNLILKDIVDDYRSEKAQVIQKNGKDFSFTVGSYIVKSMIGSIDPDLDEID
jgi:hypothetical protein